MRESQPVDFRRAGSQIPELSDVLGAEEDGILLPQLREGAGGFQSGWVGGALRRRIIRVDEDTHQRSRPYLHELAAGRSRTGEQWRGEFFAALTAASHGPARRVDSRHGQRGSGRVHLPPAVSCSN